MERCPIVFAPLQALVGQAEAGAQGGKLLVAELPGVDGKALQVRRGGRVVGAALAGRGRGGGLRCVLWLAARGHGSTPATGVQLTAGA